MSGKWAGQLSQQQRSQTAIAAAMDTSQSFIASARRGRGAASAGCVMDLLGEVTHRFAQRMDLLSEVGVLLEQVALHLGELVSVFCRSFLVGLVRPRLRLLGDDDERAGVEGDTGEDQVEEYPGLGIELTPVLQRPPRRFRVVDSAVGEYPAEDDERPNDDELHGTHAAGYRLRHTLHEAASSGVGGGSIL